MARAYNWSGAAMTKMDFEDWGLRRANIYLTRQSITNVTTFPLNDFYDGTHADDNLIVNYFSIGSMRHWPALRQFSAQNISTAKVGVKLTKSANVGAGRFCLVRLPIIKENDDDYGIYQYMLIGTDTDSLICDYHGETEFIQNRIDNNYDLSGNWTSTTTGSNNTRPWRLSNPLSKCNNNTFVNYVVSYYSMETQYSDKLRELLQHGVDRTGQNGYAVISPGQSGQYAFGFPNSCSQTDVAPITSIETVPDWLPIFYLDEGIASIIDYLDRGDDSGRKDPFDPENPAPVEIKDFTTNYELFLYKDGKNPKFTVYARNREYSQYLNEISGEYSLFVSSQPAGQHIEEGLYHKDRLPTYGYPATLSNQYTIPADGQRVCLSLYFGAYPPTAQQYLDGHYSGVFTIYLKNAKSEAGVTVDTVEYHTSPGEETYSNLPRQTVVGAYKYENTSTGEVLLVKLGSAPTMDDLGKPDEGYPGYEDDEDESTGSDPTAVVGRGFKTYRLDSGSFTEIANTFWGLTVFDGKVDPVQAIIASKSIPFSNSGTPTDTVYVSSLAINTGASYVNQVKSYEMNTSLTIGPIRGDFTDIYYTRIHLYLPFIGWVELPASEVMSRQSKVAVGIESATKRLTFKYIVDFISGDCRCVVSVNGTERFFFDGNCGADAPLTYDNHVSSIEKSAAAIGSCVLSVAGVVGGAISGNPMIVGASAVAAVNTAPNVVPNYNYTWTASASGWIGQAMNRSIVIVVESPVVREPSGYGHKLGRPCERNLTLGTLGGFTKCKGADTSSINCTAEEHQMLEDLLNTGVYL